MSLLSFHAPTEEMDNLTKDTFYDQLDKTITAIPTKQDTMVLLGDFNAKISSRPRSMNINSLLIKSTMFDHMNIPRQTWASNIRRKKRNQIDHNLIDARHGSNIAAVRRLRGFDID